MNNVDLTYLNLLKDILKNGQQKNDRTGTGVLSVFGRMLRFNLSEGFPLLTTKKVYFDGIVTELLWFLNGDTNIRNLVLNKNNIWVGDAYKNYLKNNIDSELSRKEFIENIKKDPQFAKKWGELGPIYGKQWVNWGDKGINQIKWIINELKTNPTSRRLLLNSWNVSDLDKMVLPPCHYAFQLYTTKMTAFERYEYYMNNIIDKSFENIIFYSDEKYNQHIHFLMDKKNIPKYKLSLMWSQRSVDVFLGLPFNIASYGLLLHIISKEVNMIPYELIASLGDTHIYNNHIEQVKTQIKREPKKLPIILLNQDKNIFTYKKDDFKIINYNPHPKIKGDLSN